MICRWARVGVSCILLDGMSTRSEACRSKKFYAAGIIYLTCIEGRTRVRGSTNMSMGNSDENTCDVHSKGGRGHIYGVE